MMKKYCWRLGKLEVTMLHQGCSNSWPILPAVCKNFSYSELQDGLSVAFTFFTFNFRYILLTSELGLFVAKLSPSWPAQ